jgi:2-polyprenyl-6-hydroxyphenyl methylase/3-demethylubiquinone-9 3-methyltransferase
MSELSSASSVDDAEVARFEAVAAQWWDPKGKFAPLHRFNPVRLSFIREAAERRFAAIGGTDRPFEGLRLLDIGCGGGLLSEPMTRLGFAVTGVDASERNIGVARAHASSLGLNIDYRRTTAESLLAAREPPFDVILNMEVIEHVANPKTYLNDCAKLLAPKGVMILATLNRTLKSLVLAKIGAEYILGWLPRGAHDWRRFMTPMEVRALLADAPYQVEGPFGVSYDPLADRWSRSSDYSVNYMMTVEPTP